MTLDPLVNSTLSIQLHTAAAILAFFWGGLVLFRRKGTGCTASEGASGSA